MNHRRRLAFGQERYERNFAIGEFQRVVRKQRAVIVDPPEARKGLTNLPILKTELRGHYRGACVEHDLRSGKKAYGNITCRDQADPRVNDVAKPVDTIRSPTFAGRDGTPFKLYAHMRTPPSNGSNLSVHLASRAWRSLVEFAVDSYPSGAVFRRESRIRARHDPRLAMAARNRCEFAVK
jgi:hypothetical protein